MMRSIFKIGIQGSVDQDGLDRLRTELQLTKQGRLSDSWDEAFGKRFIEPSDGMGVRVSLYRDSDDGAWSVNVSATEPYPDQAYARALQAELIEGITSAGYVPHV